jgi:hypothetical protein
VEEEGELPPPVLEAPLLRDGEGPAVAVGAVDAEGGGEGDTLGERDTEGEGDAIGVAETLPVAEVEGRGEGDGRPPVPLGEGDGAVETVAHRALCVAARPLAVAPPAEGEGDALPANEGVPPPPDALGLPVGEREPLAEPLPLPPPPAAALPLAAPLCDAPPVGVTRPLRVPSAVDPVALAEGDSDGVRAALAVPPPLDAVGDAVGRGVTEELPEGEGVASAALGEGAPVRLPCCTLTEGTRVAEAPTLAVPLGVPATPPVAVGCAVLEGAAGEAVSPPREGLPSGDRDGGGDFEGEGLPEGLTEGSGLPVARTPVAEAGAEPDNAADALPLPAEGSDE